MDGYTLRSPGLQTALFPMDQLGLSPPLYSSTPFLSLQHCIIGSEIRKAAVMSENQLFAVVAAYDFQM